MIIRGALKCETCDQPHTVRIGMGQEESQSHMFPCENCSEDMVVRLDVDYERLGTRIVCVENCSGIQEALDAPIVNLDATFLIPAGQRGRDKSFARLMQLDELVGGAEDLRDLASGPSFPKEKRSMRPFRRPDYLAEWKLLKKAWSLSRNGHDKLAVRRMEEASAALYPDEPLDHLVDWLWRLATFICQPSYEEPFLTVIEAARPVTGTERMYSFLEYYETELAAERWGNYFEMMKEFFAGYSEFGQVLFLVNGGVSIRSDFSTSSLDFDQVRMFYGNAFERFSSLVELLAMLNNMLLGREFDQFEKLTLSKYRKLDKASRFGPFAMNAPFMAICAEADNQIRNASHHGHLGFDPQMQIIRYHAGKGGAGEARDISYASYLERCVRIFLQTMTLMRVELILTLPLKMKRPL